MGASHGAGLVGGGDQGRGCAPSAPLPLLPLQGMPSMPQTHPSLSSQMPHTRLSSSLLMPRR